MKRALLRTVALALGALAAAAQGGELEAARERLRSPDARERQQAVEALAALAAPQAWELVLGALADPEPRVADEAQIRLGELRDARLVPLLLGDDGIGSRRAHVAERAAEALGRLQVRIAAGDLARHLDQSDPAVRGALAWSVERLAAAGRLEDPADAGLWKALERLRARAKDASVAATALAAMCAVRPSDAPEALGAAVESDAPELRCCAAALWRALPPSATGESPLSTLAGDPSAAVRAQVAGELARSGKREDALALASMLADERELRLSWTIVERLQDLSGLKHGRDPRPWREWAGSLPEDWTPRDGSGEHEYEGASAAFAGLPVLSGRVSFLIDLSGSMWMEWEGGRTRKQAVDVEVRRLFASLPAGTRFNVIPYTDRPLPWRKELVPATPANVRKAGADFERQNARGQGDFWGAFVRALEDPEVDTVMVLTDGAPSGGWRWNLSLMKSLLPQQNRFRKVVLDAILFDCPTSLARHWSEMCAATGGRCTTIEL